MRAPLTIQAAPKAEERAMRQDKSTPRIDEADIADALNSSVGTARSIVADLEDAGFLIMRRPRSDLTAISEAVRTGVWSPISEWDWKAWLAGVHAGFITKDSVMSQGEDAIARFARTVPLTQEAVTAGVEALGLEDEPEKDNWGVCSRVATDMAARHGCRVELSGRDDPHMPLTYTDDLSTYAVVTECSTGRVVGLVECWNSEDGDPIVPRTWLEITLGAWTAEGSPKRRA